MNTAFPRSLRNVLILAVLNATMKLTGWLVLAYDHGAVNNRVVRIEVSDNPA